MRKLTQKTWDNLASDYKMIKEGQKYAMLDATCLEPVEIDNEKGIYYAKITFKSTKDDIITECIRTYYDPQKSDFENLAKALSRTINYNECYKYFVDNKKINILNVERINKYEKI